MQQTHRRGAMFAAHLLSLLFHGLLVFGASQWAFDLGKSPQESLQFRRGAGDDGIGIRVTLMDGAARSFSVGPGASDARAARPAYGAAIADPRGTAMMPSFYTAALRPVTKTAASSDEANQPAPIAERTPTTTELAVAPIPPAAPVATTVVETPPPTPIAAALATTSPPPQLDNPSTPIAVATPTTPASTTNANKTSTAADLTSTALASPSQTASTSPAREGSDTGTTGTSTTGSTGNGTSASTGNDTTGANTSNATSDRANAGGTRSGTGAGAAGPASGGGGGHGDPNGSDTSQFIRPVYPARSLQNREQGTVILDVEILADGSVGQVKVARSSGHDRLDNAAIIAVKRSRFPASNRPAREVKPMTFEFRHPDMNRG